MTIAQLCQLPCRRYLLSTFQFTNKSLRALIFKTANSILLTFWFLRLRSRAGRIIRYVEDCDGILVLIISSVILEVRGAWVKLVCGGEPRTPHVETTTCVTQPRRYRP